MARKVGYPNLVEVFERNGIDFNSLDGLTNADLKDLGVSRLVDRKASTA